MKTLKNIGHGIIAIILIALLFALLNFKAWNLKRYFKFPSQRDNPTDTHQPDDPLKALKT